ncbi:MAG: cyclic nucleotide-binding domain-containing protein [Deltaproteobacteria bacterium]|nr:cyclic nucleotide-binding domain-containing protein [Deltaproteobacteria bacterium]
MALDPGIVSTAKERAEGLFARGMYSEALATYEKIKAYGEKDPRIFLRMGDIARKDNDDKAAVNHYKSAAGAFGRLGFVIKAIAVCKMIINIDPTEEAVQKKLAELCAGERQTEGHQAPTARLSGPEPKAPQPQERHEPPVTVPKTPLFSDFNEAEFLEVVRKVRSKALKDGEYLFREGDPGDSIFLVAEGEVEVEGRAKDSSRVKLATLKEGSIFGEFGFFSGSRRTSDVRAVKDSVILEITKAEIEEIIRTHERVSIILFNFYKERVVDRLMALSEIFKPLSAEDRKEILGRLTLKRFDKGASIAKEGERGDTMYLIKSGAVQVWVKDKKGAAKTVATLSEGDFFGEIALATSRPRVASVTALQDTELVEFGRSIIKDVLGRYPEIKGVLERVIRERVTGAARARDAENVPLL